MGMHPARINESPGSAHPENDDDFERLDDDHPDVVRAGARLSHAYVQIPLGLLTRASLLSEHSPRPTPRTIRGLSANALRLYAVLATYIRPSQGKTTCWPSLERLRASMGPGRLGRGEPVALKTVLRAREELLRYGILEIEQTGGGRPPNRRRDWEYDDDYDAHDQDVFGFEYAGRRWTRNKTVYRLRVYVRKGRVVDERGKVPPPDSISVGPRPQTNGCGLRPPITVA